MLALFSFETDAERDTFEYLYEKYKKLMWRKAYDILKDYSLAEDAVSEAFIRVYRNIHRIAEPDSGQTASFLVTIVKNTAIDLYNKKNKLVQIPLDSEHERADSFNLEEAVSERDEAARAVEMVDRLSEEMRAVFLLKYAHDLPHKEIAQILNTTENNVTVRLHRAKKRLLGMAKNFGKDGE
ncbi:MAG: sigma-70 family RNA polymerase sigma factor [Defluviitaleaceae bacterium]|nr:sigma-70 family RNA polymerase sigma factor [Defluviitaleaceae bacterium]